MPSDDADLREIRELYHHDQHEWSDIVSEGDTDMRYAAGDPWEPEDRQMREEADRPCLNADEINQYINVTVNDVRANKRGVKFSPNGRGASEQTAELYGDKMREVEYRSQAQVAYTTAFQDAVMRSYGFLRINTRWSSEQSFDQDVWIEPVHNPNLITPDAQALMPTMSDMEHIWLREPYSHAEFNRRFPDHTIDNRHVNDLTRDTDGWIDSNRVFVGEYWRKTYSTRKLLLVQPTVAPPSGSILGLRGPANVVQANPLAIFEDDFKKQGANGEVLRTRSVDWPSIEQVLTNGYEIIETNPWAGKYIPFVACLGRVLYLSDTGKQRRVMSSMVRLARDPQMLYAFIVTNEAESFGMAPKFPYFVYKGQLDQKNLELLNNSNKAPVAVIEVEPQIEGIGGDQPVQFPQRNPYDPPAAAYEIAKESARRMIQAAMAQTPLPSAAQRQNQKSAKALQKIDEIGQRGSFHFTDHYLDMIQQVGIICEDLFEAVLDGTRTISLRRANDDAYSVRVNDPSDPASLSLSGDHLVTVSTGPSFESQRDEASEFADTLAQVSPQVFALLGPLIVKLKNLGPIGDEMADLLKALQPPEVRALEAQKHQGDPRQAQQELALAKGEMQKMQGALQKMEEALKTDQVKAQAGLQEAQIRAQADVQKAEIDAQAKQQQTLMETDRELALQVMKNSAQIAVAHLAAAAKGVSLEMHAQEEAQALGHDAMTQARDHAHEAALAGASAHQAPALPAQEPALPDTGAEG